MTTGVVIPHASGARVVVTALHIESAWRGVIEGVPGEKFFADSLAREAARWRGREVRARGFVHPPRTAATSARPVGRWGPQAPQAPRWIVCAAADVLDARLDEARRAMTFAWMTNRPFELSVEEMLHAGIYDMPLEGDVAPVLPDERADWRTDTTRDGVTVFVESLTLCFVFDGAPADAVRKMPSPYRTLVTVPLVVDGVAVDAGDAAVLALADFDGPAVEGPRNPNRADYYEGTLALSWVAPATGDTPLKRLLRDVLTGVSWHELATPSLGP